MIQTDSLPERPAESGFLFSCKYSLAQTMSFLNIWLIITIVTLGLGSFFGIYHYCRNIINHTHVHNPSNLNLGRLDCDPGLLRMLGHVIPWILITIVPPGVLLMLSAVHTGELAAPFALWLGICLLFYTIRTFQICLNQTRIVAA